MKLRHAHSGFSIVELVVVLAILGFLLGVGIPAFSSWTENLRIRASAESVRGGLILARGEALRRNTIARFSLFDTNCTPSTSPNTWTGGADWIVSLDDPTGQCSAAPSPTASPRVVQRRQASQERTTTGQVTATQSMIAFSGLGGITPSPGGNITINVGSTVKTCGSREQDAHCLRIVISPSGQVRMCDPIVTDTSDPRVC